MLKEQLDKLKKSQRALLIYALEHDLEQYVELDSDQFVGVNVKKIKHLRILESTGKWSFGIIKGKMKEPIL